MEMKKLLRGYGIREVNLLNKEIMVSTMKNLWTPFLGQSGKFNENFMFFKVVELGSPLTSFCQTER